VTNSLNKADALLNGGLKGKTVLIPAGLSGTGSVAAQLAKHVYGASKVITTVSTSKIPLVPKLIGDGTVDQIIDYKTQDIRKEVPPASVDLAFDTPGIMTSLIPLVKPSGLLLSIASMPAREGTKKEYPDAPSWMLYLLDIVNWYYSWKLSGKHIHYEFVYGAHNNGKLKEVGRWVEEKKLRPVVGKVVGFNDLEAIRDGCTEIFNGTGSVGKFVIQVVPEGTK
jgi:NADPH:quinone reductase-like Zn-dependent oxidoreductase